MPPKLGRILVLEDDGDCSRLITTALERAGFSTVEASTGDQALKLAHQARPSAVLLDINVPGVNGYEVCSELRAEFGPDLPIAFLSGERTESFDKVAGFLIGADDYIVKPFDPDELVARMRTLARRAPLVQQENGDRAEGGRELGPLTRREDQVFRLLAEGLSQREIAAALFISEKTVATHIQRVLKKLGVRSRAQAVALAARGARAR